MLATYFYLNVVPMWQVINNGNWKRMEESVRKLAIDRHLDLEVYAGGIGQLCLPNSAKKCTPMFLYEPKTTDREPSPARKKIVKRSKPLAGSSKKPMMPVRIPIPEILFKVVYDPVRASGVVFLTINNPYFEKLDDDYQICPDVCEEINWINWAPSAKKKGISYCCKIDEFALKYPHLPKLRVKQLLR